MYRLQVGLGVHAIFPLKHLRRAASAVAIQV
jgi:hypothetical protein